MAADYSGRPLVKKLGIKAGFKIRVINEPINYFDLLGFLPEDIVVLEDGSQKANFIHVFCEDLVSMTDFLNLLKDEIEKDGMIWISWYKKSAKIPTDLNGNEIRAYARSLGLIDAKVCAVDELWSAIKLVWRKELR